MRRRSQHPGCAPSARWSARKWRPHDAVAFVVAGEERERAQIEIAAQLAIDAASKFLLKAAVTPVGSS